MFVLMIMIMIVMSLVGTRLNDSRYTLRVSTTKITEMLYDHTLSYVSFIINRRNVIDTSRVI